MSQKVELIKVTDYDTNGDLSEYCPPAKSRKKSLRPGCRANRRCCPLWCYNRNCVIISLVLSVVATITSIAVLIGFTVSIAHPHLHVLSFEEGKCTTLMSNYTGRLGSCGCSQGGRSCVATYPCLEVFVSYNLSDGSSQDSILYASDYELSYVPHCSILPHCESGKQNKEDVEAFRKKWGTPGQTLTCLHDTTGSGAVIERARSHNYVKHILLWPCIFTAISIVLCIFVSFHCIPGYCNT